LQRAALAVVGHFRAPRVVSYNTSITAGKLAERELRTSEHKFAKPFGQIRSAWRS
jgi:hypothetical protein